MELFKAFFIFWDRKKLSLFDPQGVAVYFFNVINDVTEIVHLSTRLECTTCDVQLLTHYFTISFKKIPRSLPMIWWSNAISPSIRSVSIPNQGIGIRTMRLPIAPAPLSPVQANVYPADGFLSPGFFSTYSNRACLPITNSYLPSLPFA